MFCSVKPDCNSVQKARAGSYLDACHPYPFLIWVFMNQQQTNIAISKQVLQKISKVLEMWFSHWTLAPVPENAEGVGHFQVKIPLSFVSKSARLRITTIFNREENDSFVNYENTESLLVLQVMLLTWKQVKRKAPITGGRGDACHKSSSWKMEQEGWELTVHRSHSESLRPV